MSSIVYCSRATDSSIIVAHCFNAASTYSKVIVIGRLHRLVTDSIIINGIIQCCGSQSGNIRCAGYIQYGISFSSKITWTVQSSQYSKACCNIIGVSTIYNKSGKFHVACTSCNLFVRTSQGNSALTGSERAAVVIDPISGNSDVIAIGV